MPYANGDDEDDDNDGNDDDDERTILLMERRWKGRVRKNGRRVEGSTGQS